MRKELYHYGWLYLIEGIVFGNSSENKTRLQKLIVQLVAANWLCAVVDFFFWKYKKGNIWIHAHLVKLYNKWRYSEAGKLWMSFNNAKRLWDRGFYLSDVLHDTGKEDEWGFIRLNNEFEGKNIHAIVDFDYGKNFLNVSGGGKRLHRWDREDWSKEMQVSTSDIQEDFDY